MGVTVATPADGATEYTVPTAEQALLDSLRGEYEYETYLLGEYAAHMGEDPADAAVDFDASGVPEAIRLICADPDLRGLAVNDHTKITTSVASGVPLIEFDNGGEVPIHEDRAFDPDFPAFDPDFPIGTAIVVYGSTVASATTAKTRSCREERRAPPC